MRRSELNVFPDAAHLASWAGLCPGNAESAGKRFSDKTRKGDRYLRRILIQSAWAASHARDGFLRALFFRIAARRGLKKAAVAVAHRILTIIWRIVREGAVYRERGGDYFDQRSPERTAPKLARRLENIGFEVALKRRPMDPVPPEQVVPAEICRKCHTWRPGRCIHYNPKPVRRRGPRKPLERNE